MAKNKTNFSLTKRLDATENLKLTEVFMNKEWAEMNKTLQLQIKKKDTFAMGIDTLLELRRTLMEQIMQFKNELQCH